ncbi:nitrate/TMAO reductase, membrane-bound tetraheme cytochrome c subunit [Desulfosporosinus acidiphilus SJ4]|uniref:Nitrate/TMAO reductase, membrane-bound tetraheme cytochrome c subunit n=1 Tax=Desulfosporosinus acidiphilus (strain DSM 22704 / JCM 16185 / SJ4) TaxID=646529 RepID=I4D734_DESAJ|nr:NapC/NirT family cytochrome c [Desulfosporosinus acidiphilus]AFM41608.1 nitrate/TMAO reductase, membrane-bound tetraheme cytochrome c subunit [Desulfosporosinus acidiphilus SJ4]
MKVYQKGLVIAGLIVIAGYTSFRIGYAWFTIPSSCNYCHETEPYVISWEKAPHKEIDCRDCHETRGPFHRIDTMLRGIRDVGIQLKGNYSFLMKSVYYDSNCINCHLGDFKPETKAPHMPSNHAKIIKNGQGCNNCHRDTGHKNGLGVDAKFEALSE